jgi:hypothetical protein
MFQSATEYFLQIALVISVIIFSSVIIASYIPNLKKLILLTNIGLVILVFTITAYLHYANNCTNHIEEWITEAPDALKDFNAVKAELDTAVHFKQEFGDRLGGLFIKGGNYEYYYSKYNMPNLARWFKKGRSYISISPNGYTNICFKNCIDRMNTASGYIYNRKSNPNPTIHYKEGVTLIDSLNINDEWYAHVITCTGCNE